MKREFSSLLWKVIEEQTDLRSITLRLDQKLRPKIYVWEFSKAKGIKNARVLSVNCWGSFLTSITPFFHWGTVGPSNYMGWNLLPLGLLLFFCFGISHWVFYYYSTNVTNPSSLFLFHRPWRKVWEYKTYNTNTYKKI